MKLIMLFMKIIPNLEVALVSFLSSQNNTFQTDPLYEMLGTRCGQIVWDF
jgi:hypothetical protein